MRAVLDTNIVVSALLWGGKPYQLLQAATDGDLELYTSPVLLQELREVLGYKHLLPQLVRKDSTAEQAISLYGALAVTLSPLEIRRVVRDPDDDHVVACAIAAQADFIVSGDKDLLSLKQHQGIAILTPAPALARIKAAT